MRTDVPPHPAQTHLEDADFRKEVRRGLRLHPKTLPCKFLYDQRGSELFERICRLEEYYPTRTEMWIIERHIDEISAACGSGALLIELGSGDGAKIRQLLSHLHDPIAYMPIDISREQLFDRAAALSRDYPRLEVLPVRADYTQPMRLPAPSREPRRVVAFFPGSTIGNFEPDETVDFLRRIAVLCRRDGGLLIGADLRKSKAVVERAYNDVEGVTAAFNLNLLRRMNRELNADFRLGNFRHRAVYNELHGRIEMHIVSLVEQTIHIEGEAIAFQAGESIITEHSYKYTLDGFASLARRAGFSVRQVWTDPQRWFSLQLLALDQETAVNHHAAIEFSPRPLNVCAGK
ncbi:MAG: L-histidine N(alpha)-methyltransferase [Candidatus Binataceae bacterium]